MRRRSSSARPDWVPRRLTLYAKRSRTTSWLVRRPGHLLAWWLFLLLYGLLGIALALVAMPVYYLPAFIVPAALQLAVDLPYIPRALRAWRAGECYRSASRGRSEP
jgi:hypothetical protein